MSEHRFELLDWAALLVKALLVLLLAIVGLLSFCLYWRESFLALFASLSFRLFMRRNLLDVHPVSVVFLLLFVPLNFLFKRSFFQIFFTFHRQASGRLQALFLVHKSAHIQLIMVWILVAAFGTLCFLFSPSYAEYDCLANKDYPCWCRISFPDGYKCWAK